MSAKMIGKGPMLPEVDARLEHYIRYAEKAEWTVRSAIEQLKTTPYALQALALLYDVRVKHDRAKYAPGLEEKRDE